MKSILLTTTAIVAFAGAAAADGHAGISFAGEATLGYNDTDFEDNNTTTATDNDNDGFYWDAELDVTATAALDNGVTASATFGLNVTDNDLGQAVSTSDYVLSLASENASLSFGDVDPVAEANYGGVDGDSTTGFADQDVHFDTALFDAMLVGEVTVGDITAMMSYGVFAESGATLLPAGQLDDVDALQVYATGSFGNFTVEGAYQDKIGDDGYTVYALSASTTVAGAEITGAYIANSDGTFLAADDTTEESSIGIAVSYPVTPAITVGGYFSYNDVADNAYGVSADYVDGPISVSASYDFTGNVEDDDTDDVVEYAVEGSYDVGNGLTVLAGYLVEDDAAAADSTNTAYVAGTYDLGGGAELLVSYAMDDDETSGDEVGDPEYQVGTTVEVSFSF